MSKENTMSPREAGKKGGDAVSRNREHMAEIGRKGGQVRKQQLGATGYQELGRKGGEVVSRDRQHMSEIGRKGGQSRTHGQASQPSLAADRID